MSWGGGAGKTQPVLRPSTLWSVCLPHSGPFLLGGAAPAGAQSGGGHVSRTPESAPPAGPDTLGGPQAPPGLAVEGVDDWEQAAADLAGEPFRPPGPVEGELLTGPTAGPRPSPPAEGGGDRLVAYASPHMELAAETEQRFAAVDAPLFETVESEVAAAREAGCVAQLKTAEAVQEAREWVHIIQKGGKDMEAAEEAKRAAERQSAEAGKLLREARELQAWARQEEEEEVRRQRAPSPGTPTSPLTGPATLERADKLALQAADLEMLARRKEAEACYLLREAAALHSELQAVNPGWCEGWCEACLSERGHGNGRAVGVAVTG